jgi:hypothetical protein
MRTLVLSLAVIAITGCTFDEHLPQVDVRGTVVLPREAAVFTVTDAKTGDTEEVEDVRAIGPVILGVFPSISADDFGYPHPEMGPIIVEGTPGNTYPYGGGTVGRYDFACFSDLSCRIVTGRFKDFDDILNWYSDTLGDPVVDEFGQVVDSDEYFRAYCYELFEMTTDRELSFLSEYLDTDGNIVSDLDFQQNADGDYEAEFDLWQVTYEKDMKIWGWMDSPSENFTFSTCDLDRGQENNEYSNDYYYGANFTDLINFPSKYIYDGDWTVQDPYVFTELDADDYRAAALEPSEVSVRMDYLVGAED